MRLIYVNISKVTKLEQKKMNNSESFLLLLKNLLKCTYEVLLPSQRYAIPMLMIRYNFQDNRRPVICCLRTLNVTKKRPRTSSIVQFIFYFGPLRSAEIF